MDISEIAILNPEEIKSTYFVIIKREIVLNGDETSDSFSQKEKEYFQEIESGKKWIDISFFRLKNTCLISIEHKRLFSFYLSYIIFIFLSLGQIYEYILYLITVKKNYYN